MTKRKLFFALFALACLLMPDHSTNAGWLGWGGTYPIIPTAQCEAKNGSCRTRAPGFDGCTLGTDKFIGYCDVNNGAGCCIPTETIIDNESLCNTNGGRCSIGDANCFKLNTDPKVKYDPIGYCDGAAGRNACCKLGAANSGDGVTEYCVNTLKGACTTNTTCASGSSNKGICGADPGDGKPRICCVPQDTGKVPNLGIMNYTLLEEIPGSSETRGDLGLYIQNLYKFTFWAIGVAALFMLTVGGFMYVTAAGNTSRISTAKTIITDSLLGIVVALFAWLFLYIINPDLTEGLALPNTASTPVTGGGGGGGGVPAPADAKAAAQAILAGGTGISLNGSGSCATTNGTAVSPQFTLEQVANGQSVTRCMNGCPAKGACTQTTSLNTQMLLAMIEVARTYPFTVTSITGGSHCEAGIPGCKGLSSHYAGNAIDITTPNKSSWPAIVSAFRKAGSDNGQTFCDYNGTPLPSDRCNEANHIHIAF